MWMINHLHEILKIDIKRISFTDGRADIADFVIDDTDQSLDWLDLFRRHEVIRFVDILGNCLHKRLSAIRTKDTTLQCRTDRILLDQWQIRVGPNETPEDHRQRQIGDVHVTDLPVVKTYRDDIWEIVERFFWVKLE